MKTLLLAAFFASLIPTGALANAAGEEALAEMTAAYPALRSYQDTGVVQYTILGWDQEISFETAFVRPGLFKFAWVTHHPFPPLKHLTTSSAIWANGSGTVTTRDGFLGEALEPRREDSLSLAVAGATGVSGGSANTIATLLMPDIWGPSPFGVSLIHLSSPTVTGVEVVEGVPCDHVVGTSTRGLQYDVWIGTNDHLLRKKQSPVAGSPQVELRRNIQIDGAIATERFSPPPR